MLLFPHAVLGLAQRLSSTLFSSVQGMSIRYASLRRIFAVEPLASGKPYTMRLKQFICKNLLYNTEEDEEKDNYGIWVFAQIVFYFKENHFVFLPKRFSPLNFTQ